MASSVAVLDFYWMYKRLWLPFLFLFLCTTNCFLSVQFRFLFFYTCILCYFLCLLGVTSWAEKEWVLLQLRGQSCLFFDNWWDSFINCYLFLFSTCWLEVSDTPLFANFCNYVSNVYIDGFVLNKMFLLLSGLGSSPTLLHKFLKLDWIAHLFTSTSWKQTLLLWRATFYLLTVHRLYIFENRYFHSHLGPYNWSVFKPECLNWRIKIPDTHLPFDKANVAHSIDVIDFLK